MHERRFPRLIRRALLPAIVLATVQVPVHPASAAPTSLEASLDAVVGRGVSHVRLPLRSNLVAISVDPEVPAPRLSVRDADGSWHEIVFEDEHGPDGLEAARESARRFSEPIWLGTLDALTIRRAASTATPVRVHAINSAGDASRAPAPLRMLGAAWRALTVPRAAHAAVPDQPIVTRAQWGANESWVDGRPDPVAELRGIFVHHTDTSNGHRRGDVPAIIRGIYRYHTQTRGWSDIGYNFLVDRWGQMYEGRGGGIETATPGAHARGANTGSSGIALIGNFSSTRPTKAMRVALARLVAWKADVHQMPVVGSESIGGTRYKRISGHRDANPTACPGNAAYKLLPWLRRAALRYGLPKLYRPRPSTQTLRPDGDGADDVWRITAWGSTSDLDWTLKIIDEAGNTVHEQTFTGRKLMTGGSPGLVWDGTNDQLGLPVPSGSYRWSLDAIDGNGRAVRPASGSFTVITDHLLGTLLADSDGAYVLDRNVLGNLVARPLSSVEARSQHPKRAAIPTGDAERSRYGTGSRVGARQGALLSEHGALLVVTSATEVAPFGPGVAAQLGYDPKTAIQVTTADLAGFTRRAPITDATRHPVGAFVRDPSTGDVFRIRASDRIEVATFAPWGAPSQTRTGHGVDDQIVAATAHDLTLPVASGALAAPDGTIVRVTSKTSARGTYWYLAGGERRKIADLDLFQAYGYRLGEAIPANYHDVKALATGERIG